LRIAQALDSIEKSIGSRQWLSLDRFTLADVVLGVALQYMDFRYPHDWRGSRPALASWAATMHRRVSCLRASLRLRENLAASQLEMRGEIGLKMRTPVRPNRPAVRRPAGTTLMPRRPAERSRPALSSQVTLRA
jgi:hypothetical protein